MVRAVSTKSWTAKAKRVSASLKAEYQAGKEGDESPAMPIWPTPKEQLDKLLGLLSSTRSDSPPPEELETDAEEVTQALRGVDWASVRAATAARTSDASRAMRSVAEQVDWSKVQPIAAQVSRALIAAAASGQIRLVGPLGTTVARAIANHGGLAQRVASNLHAENASLPDEYHKAIDTTATEM
jgi:hypothetical protein